MSRESPAGQAVADGVLTAGDVGGVVAEQEAGDRGSLLGRAGPSQRNVFEDAASKASRAAGLRESREPVHDGAGHEHVDPDPVRGAFGRLHPRRGLQRGLARRVHGGGRTSPVGGGGGGDHH